MGSKKFLDGIRLQRPVAMRIQILGYLPRNLVELETLSDAASRFPIQKLVLRRKKTFSSLFFHFFLSPALIPQPLVRRFPLVSFHRRPALPAETVDIFRLLPRSLNRWKSRNIEVFGQCPILTIRPYLQQATNPDATRLDSTRLNSTEKETLQRENGGGWERGWFGSRVGNWVKQTESRGTRRTDRRIRESLERRVEKENGRSEKSRGRGERGERSRGQI